MAALPRVTGAGDVAPLAQAAVPPLSPPGDTEADTDAHEAEYESDASTEMDDATEEGSEPLELLNGFLDTTDGLSDADTNSAGEANAEIEAVIGPPFSPSKLMMLQRPQPWPCRGLGSASGLAPRFVEAGKKCGW